eukprot:gene29406-38497_t
MDLDDLLNDIDIDALPSTTVSVPKPPANHVKPAAPAPITPLEPSRLPSVGIVSSEVKPWLASSANVPKDYREKWTKMVKIDSDVSVSSSFDSSNAYRLWEPTSSSKGGINKCLQELIRKAAQRCDIDDNKLAKVLHLANPVTDSENGSMILEAFSKQLIVDLSSDILSDPNYDPAKFPALTMMLVDL